MAEELDVLRPLWVLMENVMPEPRPVEEGAEQFEQEYAARSGVTVAFLHAHGRFAEPCECGDPICEGWQMGHQWEDAIIENQRIPR